MILNRYMRMALRKSLESPHERARMACVVVKGGAVLSSACNKATRNATHLSASLYGCGHCEKRALRPHMDFVGADLYVARSNGLVSKPCPECRKVIAEAKISRIFYIDWDAKLTLEKVF